MKQMRNAALIWLIGGLIFLYITIENRFDNTMYRIFTGVITVFYFINAYIRYQKFNKQKQENEKE